jgi:Uma2 family endonuclease
MATDLGPVDLRSDPTAETTSRLLGLDVAADQDRPFELFRDWIHSRWYPKRGKFSFLGGVLEAEMSPESLFDHSLVKTALARTLSAISDEVQIGRLHIDGALFISEELEIATEPDLMFCLWSTLRDKRVEWRPYKNARKGRVEVHGFPDLMVEIVSTSSVKKDKALLKRLYFTAGIPEYWLLDARDGRLEFTIYQSGEAEYAAAALDAEGYRFSKIFNRSFLLERYPDPLGEDAYRLRSR